MQQKNIGIKLHARPNGHHRHVQNIPGNSCRICSPQQHTEHSLRFIKQQATKQTKHYSLKLKVCNKQNFGNYTNICQLGNLFVIEERLKEDIENFFETNKNGDTTCQKF